MSALLLPNAPISIGASYINYTADSGPIHYELFDAPNGAIIRTATMQGGVGLRAALGAKIGGANNYFFASEGEDWANIYEIAIPPGSKAMFYAEGAGLGIRISYDLL